VVRTHDRAPHSRDYYRPDVKAARQASRLGKGDYAKAPAARSTRTRPAVRTSPVKRAELAGKAAGRKLAYTAPQHKKVDTTRRGAKSTSARAGGHAGAIPARSLKRETLDDLGRMKTGSTKRGATKPAAPRNGVALPPKRIDRVAPKSRSPSDDLARRKTLAANGKPVNRPAQRAAQPKPPARARHETGSQAVGKTSRQRIEPDRGSKSARNELPSGSAARTQVQRKPMAPPQSSRQAKPTYRFQAPQPQRQAGPSGAARTPSAVPRPQPAPRQAAPSRPDKAGRSAVREGKADRGGRRD
jgi:hypothetical protein